MWIKAHCREQKVEMFNPRKHQKSSSLYAINFLTHQIGKRIHRNLIILHTGGLLDSFFGFTRTNRWTLAEEYCQPDSYAATSTAYTPP